MILCGRDILMRNNVKLDVLYCTCIEVGKKKYIKKVRTLKIGNGVKS